MLFAVLGDALRARHLPAEFIFGRALHAQIRNRAVASPQPAKTNEAGFFLPRVLFSDR
jgi:hypothetical protein